MKKSIIVVIAVFLIVFLAPVIETYNSTFLVRHGVSALADDILYKSLGGFKDFLSDMAYREADAYFHGGTYEYQKFHPESEEEFVARRMLEHHDEHEHHGEAAIHPTLNILYDVGRACAFTEHRHLEGGEAKEMVPWFYYAVRLNPHNEIAYSVGGFWLSAELKKTDEAVRFLHEGMRYNPDSWQIAETLGEVYFSAQRDYANARYFFEKAKHASDNLHIDKYERKKIYGFLREVCRKTSPRSYKAASAASVK